MGGRSVSDFAEYKAGTDPKNAQSVFKFVAVRPDPLGGVAVRWSSVLQKNYSVQRSGDFDHWVHRPPDQHRCYQAKQFFPARPVRPMSAHVFIASAWSDAAFELQ
jgi:hypothetical protein